MSKNKKVRPGTSIYTYLRSIGVLENGSEEEIQQARQNYWREYKRQWRKKKRRQEKEVTISLSQIQWNLITKEAAKHKLSRTRFVKQATLSYINKTFIIPNPLEVKKISQSLAMIYNAIFDEMLGGNIDSNIAKEVLNSIQALERQILPTLNHPKSLEEYIKLHIQKNPDNKSQILNLINKTHP